MSMFPLLTAENAPAGSVEALKTAREKFGMVPNVFAKMALSPALLNGYLRLAEAFETSGFTPAERQVLMLTISRHNGCHYCVAAHSAGAERAGAAPAVVSAIRDDVPIADKRLSVLHAFAAAMVEKRGWMDADDVRRFLEAGYTKAHVLDVVLAVGLKVLTNYANHIAEAPLDAAFQSKAWSGDTKAA